MNQSEIDEVLGRYDCGGEAAGDDLYFIRSQDGFCKIGRTLTLRKRLSMLQNGNPHKLVVGLWLAGMGWQEPVWHRAFYYLHQRGEWHRWDPALDQAIEAARLGNEWIATLASPWDDMTDHQWRDRIADLEADALPPPAIEIARLNECIGDGM